MLLEMRCAMSISKYQVFLKTVSCGSFSKAAEALSFTQSGISHAMRNTTSKQHRQRVRWKTSWA